MPAFNALQADFDQIAAFAFVYIREAHSGDTWPMPIGVGQMAPPAPTTMEERTTLARQYVAEHGIELPVLVDGMDDAFMETYAAWPERFFVIYDGLLYFISQPIPDVGHDPEHIRIWLQDFTSAAPVPDHARQTMSNVIFVSDAAPRQVDPDAVAILSPTTSQVEFGPRPTLHPHPSDPEAIQGDPETA